jgi:hypothetical protein
MASSISYPVTFNGTDISIVPGLQVYSVNPYGPSRNLNIFQLARRSARKVSSAFYSQRQIAVSVYITTSSRTALDQSLDQLFSLIQAKEAPLVISQSGALRQYTVTYSTLTVNNDSLNQSSVSVPMGGFIDITLTFECSDSFGYDTTQTTLLNVTGQNVSSRSDNLNFIGGTDKQLPFIQITYTALSANTTDTVTVGSGTSVLQITRSWTVGDVLQIDARNQTVQVNGVDTFFSGSIPEIPTGIQPIAYTDSFNSRTYSYLIYYYKRWN